MGALGPGGKPVVCGVKVITAGAGSQVFCRVFQGILPGSFTSPFQHLTSQDSMLISSLKSLYPPAVGFFTHCE